MTCTPALKLLIPQDFKDYFFRNFVYVNDYDNSTNYQAGELVFYTNNKVYLCLLDNTIGIAPDTNPTNWELQDISQYITDKDITKSYSQACINFNAGLFSSDDDIKIGYLYLTAHYLVSDLNEGGIDSDSNNQVSSRTVGNITESYVVPEWINKDKILSYYTNTAYGKKYLSLILPSLVGNVECVEGATSA